MDGEFDVVVLGGGSAGEVAAGRLADAGLAVVLVEKELVGGACPFWACMPAKALLRPGQVLAEARGVPGARESVRGIDTAAALAWRDDMAAHWDDSGHVAELEAKGIAVVRGHGRIAAVRAVEVDGVGTLVARRAVIVATGSRAKVPSLPGAEDVEMWDDRKATTADGPPQRMLVMGGGAVGLETAQAWRRLGAQEVTVVEEVDGLLSGEEDFAGEHVATAFAAESIDVVTGCRVEELRRGDHGTEARLSDGTSRHIDVVVAAIGREPATDDLGVDRIGLTRGDWVETDTSMRSRAHGDWLFAVGDVNGQDLFTHMGKYEARIAADRILGGDSVVDRGRTAVPRIVFTDPVVAAVGATAAGARAGGFDVETRDIEIGVQAEAGLWAAGDVAGTARFVIDRTDNVLVGATFTGPTPVTEMAIAAQIAIVGRVALSALRHVVPQFPTFSEVWLEFT